MKLNRSFLCHVGKEKTGQLIKKDNIPCKHVNNLSAVAGFKMHYPATLNLILELESPKYLDCLEEIEGEITKK